MRSNLVFALLCSSLTAAAACGGDDGNSPSPMVITGGGITDPGIDGTVHVYAVDADTDLPIAGATVRVGTIEGATDATGLFTAKGDLSGPQTVAIKANGYAPSIMVGADGANITAALDRTPAPTTTPPHAEISGTITGWDALPTPAANHITAALVQYSQSPELGARDNNLAPPPSGSGLAANLCAKNAAAAPPCAWRINARVGTVAVYATMVDIATQGTATEDDDVVTVTGFATAPNLTVVADAAQSGIALAPLPAGSTATAAASFGTPPSGLVASIGIVGVDLGAAGVMRVLPIAPPATTTVVPNLSAISGSTYEFVALAREDIDDGTAAESIVLRRGLTSASSLAAGEWLVPPTGMWSDRATAGFNAVAGASAYTMEFNNSSGSSGERVMNVIVLDDTTAVSLPTDFAPLPSGSLLYRVNAFDAGADFDPRDFAIDDLKSTLVRLTSETISLN